MTLIGNVFMLVGGVTLCIATGYYISIMGTEDLTINQSAMIVGIGGGIGLGLTIVGKMINNDAEKDLEKQWQVTMWELERQARLNREEGKEDNN